MQAFSFANHEEMTAAMLVATVRQQLDADCNLGLFSPCSTDELDRIAARSVESLWDQSRIKAFLPLLALRQAREELRDAERFPSQAPYPYDNLSIDHMLRELEGPVGLRLTLAPDDQWHAVLFYRQEGVVQRTVRAVSSGMTMDEAVRAVIAQAKEPR